MAPTGAFSSELNTEEITIRDRKIVLRELEIGEYDEIEKQSIDEVTDPETGLKTNRFDNNRQARLMLLKCVVSAEPPLPEGGITKLGTRAVIAMNTVVNRLHYGEVDPTTGLPGALYTEMKNGTEKAAKAKGAKPSA